MKNEVIFRKMRSLTACLLTAVLVSSALFTAAPKDTLAASKKPAKVKITNASVDKTDITLTWKKAKRASKYQVALRIKSTKWKYWKKVKKTAANQKKYSSAKYKLKKSGKKYKVYRKKATYKYKVVGKTKDLKFTYKAKAGETCTFAVRGVKGKKKGKWSKPITRTAATAAQIKAEELKNVSEKPVNNAAGLMGETWKEPVKTTGGSSSGSGSSSGGSSSGKTTPTPTPKPAVDENASTHLSRTNFKLTKGYSTTISLVDYNGTGDVSWKTSNASIIAIKETSGTKKITAKLVGKADSGSATITATAGGKSYKATVTARPAPALSRTSFSLTKGYSTTITLNNYYGTKDITWSSSNAKVIKVSTLSGTHKVTAKLVGVATSGSATITANANGTKYTAKVTAKPAPSIKEGDLTLPVGTKQKLTLQNYSGTPKWTSSNTSVATVSSSGVVTVKASSGKATITATAGGKKASCVITARKKTPEESTTYVKKTYSYNGKPMIKADVPKGWTLSVAGIDAGGCEPVIMITDSTGKYGVYYRITMTAAKTKASADYWKTNTGLDLMYPIPVKGYAKNGYDAAGLFAGLVTHSGAKSYAIEKKLPKKTFMGSDILVTKATDKKGNKLRYVFAGQVNDIGSYNIYYKGATTALSSAVAAKEMDVWFLLCQDISFMQAPYNDLDDWIPVLGHIYASIEYTKECVKHHAETSGQSVANIQAAADAASAQSEAMVKSFLEYINS